MVAQYWWYCHFIKFFRANIFFLDAIDVQKNNNNNIYHTICLESLCVRCQNKQRSLPMIMLTLSICTNSWSHNSAKIQKILQACIIRRTRLHNCTIRSIKILCIPTYTLHKTLRVLNIHTIRKTADTQCTFCTIVPPKHSANHSVTFLMFLHFVYNFAFQKKTQFSVRFCLWINAAVLHTKLAAHLCKYAHRILSIIQNSFNQ